MASETAGAGVSMKTEVGRVDAAAVAVVRERDPDVRGQCPRPH